VETAPQPSGVRRLLHDVAHDYRDFLSVENGEFAAVGGTATAVIHGADDFIRDQAVGPTPTALKPGSTSGNLAFQFPLAIGWWAIGHAASSARGSDAGRDLLRAQISAASWTYAIKYSVDRTRPNGDPRSFPSGHTSASFATATVLQQHYGWKLGLPAFALATYTAVERVYDNKHWASDVAFGAVVGMLSGRTVALHVRKSKLHIEPRAMPGGGAIEVHVLN
jgi:membrane-associated phospholipid phosphatase